MKKKKLCMLCFKRYFLALDKPRDKVVVVKRKSSSVGKFSR